MSERILFIVNPKSGTGKKRKILSLLEAKTWNGRSFDLAYTTGPGHATTLAREAAGKGYNVVVAVGGDGSVNEAGKGLKNTALVLGILPAGSGNGLARHLGISMDPTKALDIIFTGKNKRIDTGTLNGTFFAGIAGLGLDAHIADSFARFGKRGFSSYARVFLKEFPRYKARRYQIGDKTYQALLITFANSSQFGNNAIISPKSDVSDGQLECCIVSPLPVYRVPGMLRALFKGKLEKQDGYRSFPFEKLEIQHPGGPAHVDGEPLNTGEKISVECHKESLWVRTP
jgi:diacylglycerol kinase (ATP)